MSKDLTNGPCTCTRARLDTLNSGFGDYNICYSEITQFGGAKFFTRSEVEIGFVPRRWAFYYGWRERGAPPNELRQSINQSITQSAGLSQHLGRPLVEEPNFQTARARMPIYQDHLVARSAVPSKSSIDFEQCY